MYDIKNEKFEDIVEKVLIDYKDKSDEEVNAVVNQLCEEYVQHFGKKPPSYQLTLLADLILKEDMRNPSSHKVQEEEYPFLSNTQRKRRNKREFVAMDDTLEHMNYKRKNNLTTSPPQDLRK